MSFPSILTRSNRAGTDQTADGYSYQRELPADENSGRWNFRHLKLQASVLTSLLLLTIGCGRLSTAPDPGASSSTEAIQVVLTEAPSAVKERDRIDFDAEVRDGNGNVLDRAVEWSSSDTSVASVDTAGSVLAKRVGHADVHARVQGSEATAGLDVERRQVADVNVSPNAWSLGLGQRKTFTATAKDSNGVSLLRDADWSSTDNDVATVDSVGRVTARSTGSAGIVAEVEGVADTAELSVDSSSLQMPSELTVEESSRSDTEVTYVANWSEVAGGEGYSWEAGANDDSWRKSGSVTRTSEEFTVTRESSDDPSYFCVRAVGSSAESEDRCDGFTVPGTSSGGEEATTSSGDAEAVVVEDFQSFTDTDDLHQGDDDLSMFAVDHCTSGPCIELDQNEGVPELGTSQSVKYNHGDGEKRFGMTLDHPDVWEVWYEVWVKFDDDFKTNWGEDNNPDYKFLLSPVENPDQTTGKRWGHQLGVYGNSYTLYAPSYEGPDSESGSSKEWDGEWHRWRLHYKSETSEGANDGVVEAWIASESGGRDFYMSATGIDTQREGGRIKELHLGRNQNQTGDEIHNVWWGKVKVWTDDPGW